MFWSKSTPAFQQTPDSFADLTQDPDVGEVHSLRAQCREMLRELEDLRAHQTFLEGVFAHIHTFSVSAKEIQGSLAALSRDMHTERTLTEQLNARQTLNRQSIEHLSARLREMALRFKTQAVDSQTPTPDAATEIHSTSEPRTFTERTLKPLQDIQALLAQSLQETERAAVQTQDLAQLTHQMNARIAARALRSFIETAKYDHLIYKLEVYKVLLGVSDKHTEEFASHTRCALGKWYYTGDGKAHCTHLHGYAQIEAPHMQVHRFGFEALECAHGNDNTRTLELLARMEEASSQVLAALEEMANQKERAL